MRLPLIFPFVFLVCASPARADDYEDKINGLIEESGFVNTSEPSHNEPAPAPSQPSQIGTSYGDDRSSDTPTSPPVAEPAKVVQSPFFNLDEENRFREWLKQLCDEDPVESDLLTQRKFQNRSYTTRTAKKKVASLSILLENYIGNIKQRAQGRPKNRAPAIAGTVWLGDGPWKFPASSSHPEALNENLKSYSSTLKAKFAQLRDLAKLDGTPNTADKALRIFHMIQDNSLCQTRAFKEVRTNQK